MIILLSSAVKDIIAIGILVFILIFLLAFIKSIFRK